MGNSLRLVERNATPLSVKKQRIETIAYFDAEKVKQLLADIKNEKHKMFFSFLWMSGLRVTEAISLRKRNIDFTNYVMCVRWLKSRKYQERNVPIHPILCSKLQGYVATMRAEDEVFPISRQHADRLAKQYLEGGHCHMLRHSFAVHWLRCGGNIEILRQVLGHTRLETTAIYTQISPMEQGKELLKVRFD